MASAFVTTTARNTRWAPYAQCNYERVLRAASRDVVGRHTIVTVPDNADIILFVEANSHFQFDILRSQVYRQFGQKCFVFDSLDRASPFLPGLYMDMPCNVRNSKIFQYGFYIRVFDDQLLETFVPHSRCNLLFSFMGKVSNCPTVRGEIVRLRHPRSLLIDVSSNQVSNVTAYVEVLQKSKFVICPRGFGASTWRCFETMRAGRVPVIVSDCWSPPNGLKWEKFSIHIPESEIETIPNILQEMEDRAEDMGVSARVAWEENFSIEKSFDWIVERCLQIQPHLPASPRLLRNRLLQTPSKRVTTFVKDFIRNGLLPLSEDAVP